MNIAFQRERYISCILQNIMLKSLKLQTIDFGFIKEPDLFMCFLIVFLKLGRVNSEGVKNKMDRFVVCTNCALKPSSQKIIEILP